MQNAIQKLRFKVKSSIFQLRADSIQDLSYDSLSPGRRGSQPGRFFRKRSRSDVGKNLKIIAKELKKQCKNLGKEFMLPKHIDVLHVL